MTQEINLTLFHPPTSRTDAISLPLSATVSDLASFASALLDLDGEIIIRRDATVIFSRQSPGEQTLQAGGVRDGDFLTVWRLSEVPTANSGASPARQRARTSPPAASGALDFSALLAANNSAQSSATSRNNGGLSFNIPGLVAASAAASQPIEWDGMNLDDAIQRNPNPLHLMTLFTSPRHPNLLKELNYHNPQVYKRLTSANGDVHSMASIWRETMMKSTTARFLQRHDEQSKEVVMRQRLSNNPQDIQANAYFAEKIRKENVQRQYEQMMEEYPESMGRVLMLYINCTVKEKPLQVFVDSGAQTTIMSSACADRLGLLHLVDDRFEGTAVGVGTGKILGKIHIVDLNIGGYDFPCSITVMDSKEGLGDKNMDCLFGLDMLKRHRCCIDLGRNVLKFPMAGGGAGMEAEFLHEKDLPVEKGGTLGFDAERENAEFEARWEKYEKEDSGGKTSNDGEK
ncbi:hypothetical protein ACHAWX_000794 [Stephanocyclus meneghinianus]